MSDPTASDPAASDPVTIVTAFFAAWSGGHAAIYGSIRDHFAADGVWENVGLTHTVGPEAAVACFANFPAIEACARIDVEMLAIAAIGETVLTERIDHVIGHDGNEIAPVRVMGALKVTGGRIAAWRDYFDTVPFATTP